ncbi:MAG: hypothetical protein JF590_05665 [Gemmatimonadetes bacterium]|nr:hypothetical protein [Gemmatimonadota bacterium]
MKRLALVMAGCTTLRGRADTAYAHGDFMQAAQLYDKLVTDNPGDRELIARRERARAGELGRELSDVQAARYAQLDGEHTGRLALLLDQRDSWGGVMPAELQPALATEVDAAAARISDEATAKLAAAGPLAAQDTVAHYTHLLARADFTQQRGRLHESVSTAGQARCTQLAEVATTPYWSMLADRYCAHFGVIRDVPQLPEQRTALAIDGAAAGESDDETRALRGALTQAFQKSPWFATNGTGSAHAIVDGTVEVGASSREVTLTATWTEQVSYTDYETQSESYQEPYDDTATYTETVNDPDGTSHTEVKTRTVTNYRTAYRDVQVPVTKYRDEARSQDYPAIERDATYRSRLRLRSDGGLPEITASVEGADQQHGYDVDATIGAAGVSPSGAHLMTHEQFAAGQHDRLAARFLELLKAEYTRRFCTQPTYTIEEAARCTMAGFGQVPQAARESLGQVLGSETSYLGAVLAN